MSKPVCHYEWNLDSGMLGEIEVEPGCLLGTLLYHQEPSKLMMKSS